MEPITYRILNSRNDVTVHFVRVPVVNVALNAAADAQFDTTRMVSAARLLADADVDVIAWSGTAGCWLGMDHDEIIAEAVQQDTGIHCVTSTLALIAALRALDIRRLGLVTPFTDEVNARIASSLRTSGVTVHCSRGFGITASLDMAQLTTRDVLEATDMVAETKPDAIAYICTNLHAARVIADVESRYQIPALDSVVVTLAACLAAVHAEPVGVLWGRYLTP